MFVISNYIKTFGLLDAVEPNIQVSLSYVYYRYYYFTHEFYDLIIKIHRKILREPMVTFTYECTFLYVCMSVCTFVI